MTGMTKDVLVTIRSIHMNEIKLGNLAILQHYFNASHCTFYMVPTLILHSIYFRMFMLKLWRLEEQDSEGIFVQII
jgi:hypothetical protein